MHSPAFIAVDWGTTNFRAYLLDNTGNILDTRSSRSGVKHLQKSAFPDFLAQQTDGWRTARIPILICGMAGSTIGWHDVPYVECPLTLEALAHECYQASDTLNAWIVPGLRCTSPANQPDVMRGEETQLLGWRNQNPQIQSQLIILPGTHSKWAVFRENQLQTFATAMTGELYALLTEHSILACDTQAAFDRNIFQDALRRTANASLLHQLFSTRTRILTRTLQPAQQSSYLAGLLIGSELQQMQKLFGFDAQLPPITLIGSNTLLNAYSEALQYYGHPYQTMPGEQAVTAGLLQIHRNKKQ